MASAPSTAAAGSWVTATSAPVATADSRISRSGSNPSGHARVKRNGSFSAAKSQEWATLLPSPTNTTWRPSMRPLLSFRVRRSASTWHGWYRSDNALITGTEPWPANSSTISWAKVRAAMMSTRRSSTRTQSAGVSRLPSCTSSGPRKSVLPPSSVMPMSKVARVRRLGFWNRRASFFPARSGRDRPSPRSCLRVAASERT